MAITPEDLITKSFKIVTEESGYDRNEVDDFLDELVVELRALYSERDALERQVEQLSASAPASPAAAVSQEAPSAAGAQDAAALLAMAQKVHDDYVAQGEKAKAELLDEAEKKADALVSEARQQREEGRAGDCRGGTARLREPLPHQAAGPPEQPGGGAEEPQVHRGFRLKHRATPPRGATVRILIGPFCRVQPKPRIRNRAVFCALGRARKPRGPRSRGDERGTRISPHLLS